MNKLIALSLSCVVLVSFCSCTKDNFPAPEAELLHRWSFNGSLVDGVTGKPAKYVGAADMEWNAERTAVSLKGGRAGTSGVSLGKGVVPMDGNAFTIEMWATQRAVLNWCRIFQFGSKCDNMVNMCWTGGEGIDTDAIQVYQKFPDKQMLKTSQRLAPYSLGEEFHISMVVEPNRDRDGVTYISIAKRDSHTGRIVAKGEGIVSPPWKISDATCEAFYLGHAHSGLWSDDAAADYNEVRIWKGVLSDEQLTESVRCGPDAQLPR